MTTFSRWLPAITQSPVIRRSALTAAGLALVGGAIAGPAVAAEATPATGPVTQSVTAVAHVKSDHDKGGHDKDKRDDDKRGDKPAARTAKGLNVKYESQPNFYYCGPASTRIALTASGHNLSQDDVAKKLGTTEAGTNSAEDTTRVLNEVTGGKAYKTTALPDEKVSPEQMDRLQADVKRAIDENRAVVANIVGTATDTDGGVHSYAGGHYVTIVGYRDDGRAVQISDPANPNVSSYWVSTIDMANWMATRGYSH